MSQINRGLKSFSGTESFAPDDPVNIARSAELDTDFDIMYSEFNGNITNENVSPAANIDGAKLNLSNHITDAMIAPGADIDAGTKIKDLSVTTPKLGGQAVTKEKIEVRAVSERFEVSTDQETSINLVVPGAGGSTPYTDLLDYNIFMNLRWPFATADIWVWVNIPIFGTVVPAGVTGNQAFTGRAYVSDGVAADIKSNEVRLVQGISVLDPASPPKFLPNAMLQGLFVIPDVTAKLVGPFWTIKLEIKFTATKDGNYTFLINPQTVPGGGNLGTMHALVRHR